MAYGIKKMKRKLEALEAGGKGMNPGSDPNRIKRRIRFLENKADRMEQAPSPSPAQGPAPEQAPPESADFEQALGLAVQNKGPAPSESMKAPGFKENMPSFPPELIAAISQMYRPTPQPQRPPISGGKFANWQRPQDLQPQGQSSGAVPMMYGHPIYKA